MLSFNLLKYETKSYSFQMWMLFEQRVGIYQKFRNFDNYTSIHFITFFMLAKEKWMWKELWWYTSNMISDRNTSQGKCNENRLEKLRSFWYHLFNLSALKSKTYCIAKLFIAKSTLFPDILRPVKNPDFPDFPLKSFRFLRKIH